MLVPLRCRSVVREGEGEEGQERVDGLHFEVHQSPGSLVVQPIGGDLTRDEGQGKDKGGWLDEVRGGV